DREVARRHVWAPHVVPSRRPALVLVPSRKALARPVELRDPTHTPGAAPRRSRADRGDVARAPARETRSPRDRPRPPRPHPSPRPGGPLDAGPPPRRPGA